MKYLRPRVLENGGETLSEEKHDLRDGLAEFLKWFVWHHCFTGTFAFACSAIVALERFEHFANGLCRITGGAVHYFVVAEPTYINRFHVHALIQGSGDLDVRTLAERWKRRNGGSVEVTRYRPGGGWEEYVVKGVSTEFDAYRFSPKFEKAERREM